MLTAMEKFSRQMTHAIIAAILASALPLAGADSQPHGKRIADPAAPKQWRVKYMGGPGLLKRGTPVGLEVSERTITYGTIGSRPDKRFSIPVGAVTDVSDETIGGDLSEKVYGPGEPDYISPCGSVRDVVLGSACVAGGLAVETPFAVAYSVFQNIPFKDHFVRLKWHANGEGPEVVFKVSGKDEVALREELERVTGQGGREEEPQEQATQAAIYDAPVTHTEQFDRKTTEARERQWLTDQCQGGSSDKPIWLKAGSIFDDASLCPLSASSQAHERARLTK
jgi:hypothetical protein